MIVQIPEPPAGFAGSASYVIRPREKPMFHGVLDAKKLLAASGERRSAVTWSGANGHVELAMEHPILGGTLRETVKYARQPAGLATVSLEREVHTPQGARARREEVLFHHDQMGLPSATYPEVTLPFILGWLPHDGKRRSMYAWINDRFVAKLYYETVHATKVHVPSGTHEAFESVMYPDLNDWVPLGTVLTRLAKPFLPKYRMWHAKQPPHRVLRFEGPYGPPGAPELILEHAG